MIVEMDKMSAPTKELAQRLYEKNAELDGRRRKSLLARIPSDPNIWQQMRENYETIILEDHAFSEQHNIEHALWQLHYKKIEELRAHYSAAQASVQGGKGPARPDQLAKIRLQLKTFLSEATGFYHDLIMKIRAKYGLPLGYFSEDSENRIGLEKDVKKLAEMKKGLISSHRCLIYLGDLARYKGLYGEANAKAREYTAASSYYLQAASLWPSIGNPHHQLAILASYSGDDFLTVYRYFRSLSVDSPCSTARDNLVVAFEKNCQSYSQLPCDKKPSAVCFSDKKRGREVRQASKESDAEAGSVKDKDKKSSSLDAFKSFCIRFIRLNGILFTRTSLETFTEVLSLVSTGLLDLLSSAKEGDLKFGANSGENAVFFVRLVAILIFTVQNSKKENEGQTYAEIVQRAVLLQNAFSAAFVIVGLLLERCERQPDPSSSYLLPGVLVFVEWLACCPDVLSGSDADGKQAACRSAFWVHFISFANKLLSTGSISVEDNEETCFNNMSTYDEGETENRLALSEDFELRGFLPIVPAQTILDFCRKHSFGTVDQKEQTARVKRILAAGKALLGVVKIDQKSVHYESREKKFFVGVEPRKRTQNIDHPDTALPPSSATMLESNLEIPLNSGRLPPDAHLDMEDEEEEEVILFQPTVSEKHADVDISSFLPTTGIESVTSLTGNCKPIHGTSHSSTLPLDNLQHQAASDALLAKSAVLQNVSSAPQHFVPTEVSPNWLLEKNSTIVNSFRDLRLVGNGHLIKSEGQNIGNFQHTEFLEANPYSIIANNMGKFYALSRAPEPVLPTSRIGAVTSFGIAADNLVVKPSPSPPPGMKKHPVSQPVRHVGPPPGFGPVPKPANGSLPSMGVASENPINDDYRWLDGYQLPPPLKSTGFSSSAAFLSHANSPYVSDSVGLTGSAGFPFPGKQVPVTQLHFGGENGQPYHQKIDYMKLQEERLLQANGMLNGNHNLAPQPELYQETLRAGRYIV